MSLAKKLKKRLKQIGRRVQTVGAKAVKYGTPVLGAVGTFFGGPLLGGAITAAGGAAARGMGATAARAKGLKGKEARTAGRKVMQKTLKYGLLGTGAGMAGAGIFAALSGGNVLGALLGGQQNVFGIGGGASASPGVDTMPGGLQEEADYMARMMQPGAQGKGYGDTSSTPGGGTGLSDLFGTALDAQKAYYGKRLADITQVEPKPGGGFLSDLFGPGPDGEEKKIMGLPAGLVVIGGGVLALVLLSKGGRKAA